MPEPDQGSQSANGSATGEDAGARPGSARGQKAPEAGRGGADQRSRLDQVEAILAKGLDLVEASVSLGVTILSRVGSRVGSAIQHPPGGPMMGAAMPTEAAYADPGPGRAVPPADWPYMEPTAPEHQGPPEPALGITNRLPLAPGGTVKISFSINNESIADPKRVEFRVEGFVGDGSGSRIDAAEIAVKPAQKTIAPMDFEKFYLQGTLPAGVPPDVYRGWVVVGSETELRIPVVLVVISLPGRPGAAAGRGPAEA